MELNRELMTRWIKALESDQYRQGRGSLCRKSEWGDQYCCLGVLEAIEPSISRSKWPRPATSYTQYLDQESVRRALGFYLDQQHLVNMNDGIDASFREIAQYLRETYLWARPV